MDPLALLAVVVALAALAAVAVVVLRAERGRAEAAAAVAALKLEAERLTERQISTASRQAESQDRLYERLDQLTKRLGDGLAHHTEKTGLTLTQLEKRLAVIDAAQKNIAELSQQMVGLQDILSNKQARGAHGQAQMENLVRDILPPDAYTFQAKLSNGSLVDCLIRLPNPPGSIAVDSKYPLDGYRAYREAKDERARIEALRAFRADVQKHVADIAAKYIVPGETAESALMFVPAEAVYAEIHASLPDVVEKSYRARVWIVSPTTLMATLNTMRALMRDARMRDQAAALQKEVLAMLMDVGRLDDRVEALQKHFRQATDDVDKIRISTEKIASRGERIREVQIEDDAKPALAEAPPPNGAIKPAEVG